MIITFHSFINRSIDKACCILAHFGGMGENPELRPIIPPQCEFTPVGIVSFTMPGSNDVAHKVADTLGENGRVCLIKNHGMFSCGKDMKGARSRPGSVIFYKNLIEIMNLSSYTSQNARIVQKYTLSLKKPVPSDRLYKKREKYEKNLSNNCFLLFDDFILQEDCEQPVSEG